MSKEITFKEYQARREEILKHHSDICDKITELWDVDRKDAPKFVFHDSQTGADFKTAFDKVPQSVRFHLEFLYDEILGNPKLEMLIDRTIDSYFANAFTEMDEHYSGLHHASILISMASYERECKDKEWAIRKLGDGIKNKDQIIYEEGCLRWYIEMVKHYTALCVNDALGYSLNLNVSGDLLKANINENAENLGMEGCDSAELVKFIQRGAETKNHPIKLTAERLYEQKGPAYLKSIVGLQPTEAVQFIEVIMNSDEIEKGLEVIDHFNKMKSKPS